MRMIIGTGVYVDFPTSNGNIYTRGVIEKIFSDPSLKKAIAEGKVLGGILDPESCKPIGDIITHRVIDISIYKDEVIVEIDTINDKVIKSLKHPQAAIVLTGPNLKKGGQTFTEEHNFDEVRAVHLRESNIYRNPDEY